MTILVKCQECNKEFKSAMGLQGHSRMHGPSGGITTHNHLVVVIAGREYTGTKKRIDNIEAYWKNPKRCDGCGNAIDYDNLMGGITKYCGKSCSATTTNAARPPKSEEEKKKIAEAVKQSYIDRGYPVKSKKKTAKKAVNVETAVDNGTGFNNKCKHCNIVFNALTRQKYCSDHAGLYKSDGRNRYAFTFNVFDYPELFDINLIKEKGWHSHGGRYQYNPDGLTRDHRISVNEAIRNGLDPFYIKHPLNCQIMTFAENNKKNTKSSLSYAELICKVDQFEGKI